MFSFYCCCILTKAKKTRVGWKKNKKIGIWKYVASLLLFSCIKPMKNGRWLLQHSIDVTELATKGNSEAWEKVFKNIIWLKRIRIIKNVRKIRPQLIYLKKRWVIRKYAKSLSLKTYLLFDSKKWIFLTKIPNSKNSQNNANKNNPEDI